MQISLSRHIEAPVASVFETISDIRNFAEAVPHIKEVEILSETRSGLGTRFRETRLNDGKEMTTELEVAEFVENDRVRMVADSHGTIWDTLFVVAPRDGGTELNVTMEARAYQMLSRLTTPLLQGAVQKAIEADMEAVKAYCERLAQEGRAPDAQTA